jgi:polyhydroxybutyrate depolymerase
MKTLAVVLAALLAAPALAAEKNGEVKDYTLSSGGHDRTYHVYSPAGLKPGAVYPLLLILHGGGGKGVQMRKLTRRAFETFAGKTGAVIAYPDAYAGHWNDYRADKSRKSQRENVDDVAFLSAMTEEIAKAYPVDLSRVYASGISNGAMMSHTLACRAADRIAAVAPVAGALPENQVPSCAPARPVPVMMISGTKDKLVHWEGGVVTGPFGRKNLGRTISAESTRDLWLKKNSCDPAEKGTKSIDADPDDGTSVTRETYAACAGGAVVEFLRVEGGGHTWPGGVQDMPVLVVGKTSKEVDASAEIWDFFSRFSLPPAPEVKGKSGQ